QILVGDEIDLFDVTIGQHGLAEVQLVRRVSVRRERSEQVAPDEYGCNDPPDPIYAQFRRFSLTIVVITPRPESREIVFIVLFQIVLWHFCMYPCCLAVLIIKKYTAKRFKKNHETAK